MKTILLWMVTMFLCVPGIGWAQGKSSGDLPSAQTNTPVRSPIESSEKDQNPKTATNSVKPISSQDLVNHLKAYQMELIRAQGAKEPPLPIPLTPEMDAQLVKEGVLPPAGEQVTDKTIGGEDQTVAMVFKDVPLEQVLEFYTDLTGKRIVADKGVFAVINLTTDHDVKKREAITMMERALTEKGIVLVPVSTNSLRASWVEEKRTKTAQPSHAGDGSTRAR